jgi:hypothetical protein
VLLESGGHTYRVGDRHGVDRERELRHDSVQPLPARSRVCRVALNPASFGAL